MISYIQIDKDNYLLPEVAEAQLERVLADDHQHYKGQLIRAYVVGTTVVTVRASQAHPLNIEELHREFAEGQSDGMAQLLGQKIRRASDGFDARLTD